MHICGERTWQHHSALVIPANDGLRYSAGHADILPSRTFCHAGAPIPLSETSSQHEPAGQPRPLPSAHSFNSPALRHFRLAAGIIPPWAFGQKCFTAHSHKEARADCCSSRCGYLPPLRNSGPDLTDRLPEACSFALTVGTAQPSDPD